MAPGTGKKKPFSGGDTSDIVIKDLGTQVCFGKRGLLGTPPRDVSARRAANSPAFPRAAGHA